MSRRVVAVSLILSVSSIASNPSNLASGSPFSFTGAGGNNILAFAMPSSSSSSFSSSSSSSSSSSPKGDAGVGAGAGADAALPSGTATTKNIPQLPEADPNADIPILKFGESMKFDHLGPVIINIDGTTRRIDNWDEMTEKEKEVTWRRISKRNAERREALIRKMREEEVEVAAAAAAREAKGEHIDGGGKGEDL